MLVLRWLFALVVVEMVVVAVLDVFVGLVLVGGDVVFDVARLQQPACFEHGWCVCAAALRRDVFCACACLAAANENGSDAPVQK